MTTTVAQSTTLAETTTAPPTAVEVATAALTDWACPAGVPAGAHCHRLEVPSDWSDPSSSRIGVPGPAFA